MLRGELVIESCRKEPFCLISSGGLVNVNRKSSSFCAEGRAHHETCRKEPVCLISSGGLVNVNSKSSSFCGEGRARQ